MGLCLREQGARHTSGLTRPAAVVLCQQAAHLRQPWAPDALGDQLQVLQRVPAGCLHSDRRRAHWGGGAIAPRWGTIGEVQLRVRISKQVSCAPC